MMHVAQRLASPEWRSLYAARMTTHVDQLWKEAEEEAAACADGDCLYANEHCQPRPHARRDQPACLFRHDHRCRGYLGTKHIEGGLPLMRYQLCRRHKEWWRLEQIKIRERKAREKGGGAQKAPAGWE
jgi:hypothetical protein